MSDKESADEMEVVQEQEAESDVNKNKGQKRKKAAKQAAPAKKKNKVEKAEEPKEEQAKKESTATETEDDTEEEEKPVKGLLERSPEVTGTRVRKQVERLNVTAPALESPARKNEIQPGKGVKLGTSPKIVAQLQSIKHSDMTLLHRLLFKRPGTAHESKKNIREFSGFPFAKDEKEFESRKHMLEKNTLNDLKFICGILCLEKSGTKEGIIERILEFCLCPSPSTKAVDKKAKKPKEAKKKPTKTKSKEAKGSKSPIKSPSSKETIEDDSSNDSSEAEDEIESSASDEQPPSPPSPPKKAKKEAAKTPAKAKKAKQAATPKGKKAETPKSKDEASPKGAKETGKSKKKPAAKKSPKKAEMKVKLPAVNKSKKKLAESKESETDADKADTSKEELSDAESLQNDAPESPPANEASPSPAKQSDDPSNDELVDTIKQILEDANLEDMTMKNLCKQVYEKYPLSDLEKTRKDFIRSAAKEILGNGV